MGKSSVFSFRLEPEHVKKLDGIAEQKEWFTTEGKPNRSKALRYVLENGFEEERRVLNTRLELLQEENKKLRIDVGNLEFECWAFRTLVRDWEANPYLVELFDITETSRANSQPVSKAVERIWRLSLEDFVKEVEASAEKKKRSDDRSSRMK